MKTLLALLILLMSTRLGLAEGAKADDINKAQAAYEQILPSDPDYLNALFMLGLIYEKKHQTPDALKAWKQYLALETNTEKRAIAQKHIHLLSQ